MKKNRIKFYVLIVFLVVIVDFIFDIQNESLNEALLDIFVTIPVSFLIMFITHYTRLLFLKRINNVFKFKTDSVQYQLILSGIVVIKTLFFTFLSRSMSFYLFNDETNEVYFDEVFWIILISIFTVILFVYLLEAFFESENIRLNALMDIKEYESEKAIANYSALKKQLNPHFLFNSFNSLAGLVSNDPKKAEEFIEELSSIYRYTLNKSQEVVVTLEEELELIDSYINLQQIRFKEHLDLHTNIDPLKLKLYLPPMTLELLVENAIKHNIISKEKPLKIEILTVGNTVIVRNDYRPKINGSSAESLGIGINNMVKQYSLISTLKPSFNIVDGFYIAKIPLLKSEI